MSNARSIVEAESPKKLLRGAADRAKREYADSVEGWLASSFRKSGPRTWLRKLPSAGGLNGRLWIWFVSEDELRFSVSLVLNGALYRRWEIIVRDIARREPVMRIMLKSLVERIELVMQNAVTLPVQEPEFVRQWIEQELTVVFRSAREALGIVNY